MYAETDKEIEMKKEATDEVLRRVALSTRVKINYQKEAEEYKIELLQDILKELKELNQKK